MDAKTQAYVDRIVAEARPLTPEQLDRVAVLLRGGSLPNLPPARTERDRIGDQIKAKHEERSKMDARMREAMNGCRGCGLTPKVHHIQKGHAMGYHDHDAQAPDDLIKTARSFKPKFAKIDKQILALESNLKEIQ